MNNLHVRNVNEALSVGLNLMRRKAVDRDSRNGPVRVVHGPVLTTYDRPWERVLTCPVRDANPFFHLYEAVWMLGGRNDLASLTRFLPKFKDYSDDGRTLHGAYGHRWRAHFGVRGRRDQLAEIIEALRDNHDDRRQVLQMWSVEDDLGRSGKDLPCNTHAYVSINKKDKLELTVCCRSNDMIWGAYGANAVHFSFLQQYLADMVGVQPGRMYQLSNNFHAYRNEQYEALQEEHQPDQPYKRLEWELEVTGAPIVTEPKHWENDLKLVLDEGNYLGTRNAWFQQVVQPLMRAHDAYKRKNDPDRYDAALEIAAQCTAPDWREAATAWLERRRAKFLAKE